MTLGHGADRPRSTRAIGPQVQEKPREPGSHAATLGMGAGQV